MPLRKDHLVEGNAAGAGLTAEQRIGAASDRQSGVNPEARRCMAVEEDTDALAIEGAHTGGNRINDLGQAFAAVAQKLFAVAFTVLQLTLEMKCAALDDQRLPAHLQEIAGTGGGIPRDRRG